ncbi:SPOC like C-terminal domain-containing protein [Lipomyces arxii]|uniref:SPOC like C-terminal domain-containing protein n=1 Tax=Lipomyces arxii TaxID=56418 RepID=UPI0034CE4C9B
MASKEVTVFVVDVGGGMAESHMAVANGRSDLDMCCEYLYDKIGSKVLSERKTDVVGIVGAGTRETLNSMVGVEGYEYISELVSIRQFKLQDFAELPYKLKPTYGYSADLICALAIGIDMLRTFVRHLKYVKTIVILSNCGAPTNYELDNGLIRQMVKDGIALKVFTVGANEASSSQIQRINHDRLQVFVKQAVEAGADAVFSPYEDVWHDLKIPDVRKVRSVNTYKGNLSLGDTLRFNDYLAIPVERYACISENKPPGTVSYMKATLSSEGPRNGSETPTRQTLPQSVLLGRTTKYEVTVEKDKTIEVSPENLQKGYLYGRTIVALTKEDQDNLKFQTTIGMEIVGFTEANAVKPWMLMSSATYVIAKKGDEMAATSLWSIIKALHELNYCAIARFVVKDDKPPVMVLLSPFLSDGYEALIECQLPFAEDVRSYKFPSLETIKTVKGKVLESHHYLPTQEMKDNMTAYVNAMDISSLSPDGLPADPDDPDAAEYARVGTIFNPVSAMIKQSIPYRVLHPDGELPELDPLVLKETTAPEKLVKLTSSIADKLVDSVKVKKVAKYKTNKRRYAQQGQEELKQDMTLDLQELIGTNTTSPSGGKAKRTKTDSTNTEDNDDFLENEINHWERMPAGPESDLALPRIFEQACNQIDALLDAELVDRVRVLNKLAKLRQVAFELEEPEWYNHYFVSFRDSLSMGPKDALRLRLLESVDADGLGELEVIEEEF